MFWDFDNKGVREQKSKAYFDKLFPYGETHRDTMKRVIEEHFPQRKKMNLFFNYVVLKEKLLEDDLEAAMKSLTKVRPKMKEEEIDQLIKLAEKDIEAQSLDDLINL